LQPTFEEIDWRPTPLGPLSLRRRQDMRLGAEVYEIKLGDDFLMSSAFTASEVALARAGLGALKGRDFAVVVGGLGLGYTAAAALEEARVGELLVVEKLAPVIEWHRDGTLPLGETLTGDARCRLVEGDFFALAEAPEGFDPAAPGRRFDAVLVDIDHAPGDLLNEASAGFYTPDGLAALARQIKPGGIFGLWSNEPPEADFSGRLDAVFARSWAEPVVFRNPYQERDVIQTVYLARTAI
jgi:spermidine synthase